MDYYRILGVDYAATSDEIKHAYRRLAISYHPDKNPAPQAEVLIKQINEAYDVLSDPLKREHYDQHLRNPLVVPDVAHERPRHRDPAYRPSAGKPHRGGGTQTDIRILMGQYLPLARKVILFCFSIGILLLIDFLWPARTMGEKIETGVNRTAYARNSSTNWWVIRTDAGHEISMPSEFRPYFLPGAEVTVSSSYFFGIPESISVPQHAEKIGLSIYGNFIFAPAALLIISGVGMFFRSSVEYGFNFGVVSFMILVLNGVIALIL